MRQRCVVGVLVLVAASLAGCGGLGDLASDVTIYENVTYEDDELRVSIEADPTIFGMTPEWLAVNGPDDRRYQWPYTGARNYSVDESDLGRPFVTGEYELVAHASDGSTSGNHTRSFELAESETGDGLEVTAAARETETATTRPR
ncbi:hypothetical protein SAMN05216559_1371 [Halomicrobium zhouii]|uniref:Uncharacterized protein n=1 Tax=Halomicrobium zhouii TaxID=767519 RepID=A0A1I6KRE3_9EURY|nr:hypothetical protein [Halomicrobium zhouii]SFR93776.1 hypothetical protein SAMN05216559_1371 [Halomicrobium zhouii]